jgi:hypothetical protein
MCRRSRSVPENARLCWRRQGRCLPPAAKTLLKKGFGFPKLLSKDNIENKSTSKCGRAKKSFIESS